ncbi:ribonuclease H-like domain-containing protein [Aspergillus taichungensis]|uniref:ribonuclease H n=1 Tax=Aspergillus taichungensis TaxID=482145 RepID=A0A2J5HME1_9EURO|nr:ribonuclease H-like domain-containing protein [Aspergillus taichungensis]
MFVPDSPIELPNGRLVCGAHQLVICPMCTVDYSFMDEILDDNSEFEDQDGSDEATADDDIPKNSSASVGSVIPTKFHPLWTSDTPESLFPPGLGYDAMPIVRRFIHRTETTRLLIYTDGACLNNGGANPRAGCSFVFKNSAPEIGEPGYIRFRLENQGPTGKVHQQTSNRAELRAVIAALRFRSWLGEGFSNLVIATDSEYVVEGATSWVRGWLRRDWRTRMGAPIKNRDLWECLLGDIAQLNDEGLQVEFWRIPRDWNKEADSHAKHAASGEPQGPFMNQTGLLV